MHRPSRLFLFVALSTVPLALMFSYPAQAQTFTVLHSFTGGADGGFPEAGVSINAAAELFGTTNYGAGTVFKLANKGSGWILSPLFNFPSSGAGGVAPLARSIVGPDGTLYGTTQNGGSQSCEILGCGVVYNVRPPATVCKSILCLWTENLPHEFVLDLGDGASPGSGDLLFDQAGSIYGTTGAGGTNHGTVYKLTRSGGNWAEAILYNFTNGLDGEYPESGVIFDPAGNLYGTTSSGGGDERCGTVYELSPAGSGWTQKVLYAFQCLSDGANPVGGLIFDQAGNLYGTTPNGGAYGGGTVFKLTPSGGSWTFSLLYTFTQVGTGRYAGPTGSLVMDAAGNLYGTTYSDGAFGCGAVFKLTPSGGNWTYTSLHDFTLGDDGGFANGGLAVDAHGNLYGTTQNGGVYFQYGVVFEITP